MMKAFVVFFVGFLLFSLRIDASGCSGANKDTHHSYSPTRCSATQACFATFCSCLGGGVGVNGTQCTAAARSNCPHAKQCSHNYIMCINNAALNLNSSSTASGCNGLKPLKVALISFAAGVNYNHSVIEESCEYSICLFYKATPSIVNCSQKGICVDPTTATPAPVTGHPPTPTMAPGHTLVPGQTLAPGQTLVPGQTLAPGQTLVPGQTLAPGQTLVPGQTLAPGQTLVPGQTLAPGQTLVPGQTLAPGQTLVPGQTYAPIGLNYNFVATFGGTFDQASFVASLAAFLGTTVNKLDVAIGVQQPDGTVTFYFYGTDRVANAAALRALTTTELKTLFSIATMHSSPREPGAGKAERGNVAMYVGIAAGVVIVVVIIAAFIIRRRKDTKQSEDDDTGHELLVYQPAHTV